MRSRVDIVASNDAERRLVIIDRNCVDDSGARMNEPRGDDYRLIEVGGALLIVEAGAVGRNPVMCGPMLVDDRVEVAAAVFRHVHVQRREQDAAHHEREGNQCHDQATRNGGAHDGRIICGEIRGGQPTVSGEIIMSTDRGPLSGEIRPVGRELVLPITTSGLPR